ncbi:hypothetical protein, partial [Yoonia sp. 2307UL14-13]|uniref:hypothetical protein n=1 Tax=Yoonia sp. 2307UL14-13 TaxID=3126506 RepID=UPI0030A7A0BC
TLTIPFDTGRVVILGDLHLDSFYRLAVDPIALLNREYALQTAGALILAGYQPDGWFVGHSHRRLRANVSQTDIRNVSRGYAEELVAASTSYLRAACIWESHRGPE